MPLLLSSEDLDHRGIINLIIDEPVVADELAQLGDLQVETVVLLSQYRELVG